MGPWALQLIACLHISQLIKLAQKVRRTALTFADAHRDHAVAGFATLHFIGERANQTRACHAKWVADRDRSPVHIQLFGINAQTIATIHNLHGESLVEFPQINLADRQSGAPQKLGNGKNRSDPHFVRVAPRDLIAAKHEFVRDL